MSTAYYRMLRQLTQHMADTWLTMPGGHLSGSSMSNTMARVIQAPASRLTTHKILGGINTRPLSSS